MALPVRIPKLAGHGQNRRKIAALPERPYRGKVMKVNFSEVSR
jgi:hypothetical protein